MSENLPTVKIKSSHPASQGPFVEINASDFDATKHELFVEPLAPPPPPAPLPPPPGPPDPLASLSKDWRDKDVGELRKLAAVVGGRAVENKKQAIEVIEAALKARAAR